jgi:hypothetical protein
MADSDAFRTASRGYGAFQGSLEGSNDPRNLFADSQTGKFSFPTVAQAAVQSVATTPVIQKYMDQFIDSQYGQVLPILANNPGINMALAKIPFAKTALDTVLDRFSTKRFGAMKSRALQNAGMQVAGLASDYEDLSQKSSGQSIAADTLKKFGRYNPSGKFDMARFVTNADRLMQYKQGRSLTDQERDSVRKAASEMKTRAYDTKGIHAIYDETPGGLGAQRLKTAYRELQRMGSTTGRQLQDSGNVLQEAQGKMQNLINMQGPDKRLNGTYVDVGRFKEGWDKGASYSAIYDCFANIVDKLAMDSSSTSSIVDTMSSSDFIRRQQTKPRKIFTRDFEKYGGVSDYVQAKLYGTPESLDHKKHRLSNIFKKLKKELYFKDNITYTDSV